MMVSSAASAIILCCRTPSVKGMSNFAPRAQYSANKRNESGKREKIDSKQKRRTRGPSTKMSWQGFTSERGGAAPTTSSVTYGRGFAGAQIEIGKTMAKKMDRYNLNES
jgi:hypothetical protein